MKRKIAVLCMGAILLITGIVSGSLAYFTDRDLKENTFTIGNIKINLITVFDNSNRLIPNGEPIKCQLAIKNTGKEDAYVRIQLAVPEILASMKDKFIIYSSDESQCQGKWNWSYSYNQPIDETDYRIYVVTYESLLEAGQVTSEKATEQVYLSGNVTSEDISDIEKVLGSQWEVKVIAEGVQAVGFEDAYTALDSSFGRPGTYHVDWENSR